tara:strand:+ start:189 stop:596 length:408 start_codon:yes stop_codon:yes gene_type:complete
MRDRALNDFVHSVPGTERAYQDVAGSVSYLLAKRQRACSRVGCPAFEDLVAGDDDDIDRVVQFLLIIKDKGMADVEEYVEAISEGRRRGEHFLLCVLLLSRLSTNCSTRTASASSSMRNASGSAATLVEQSRSKD